MRKKILRIAFAVVITAVSLYFAFRRVDMANVIAELIKADYVWVFLAIIVMFLGHAARALRWRVMLRSVKKIGVLNSFSAVMIGYALNQITPRGGELLRPYILGKRENISKSMLLATIVIERTFDLLSLLAIILISIIVYSSHFSDAIVSMFREGEWTKNMGINNMGDVIRVIALPFAIALAILLWLFFSKAGQKILSLPLRFFPQKIRAKVEELLAAFKEGMRVIRSGGQIYWVLFYTVCIWLAYVAQIYFPFFALHLEAYHLTFGDAFILLAIISTAVAIAPTPGAIGVYHFFCIQGMVLFLNIDYKTSAAFATLTHGFGYIFMLVTGAAFYIREHVTWKDVREAEKEKV
ncbi:MAG TPA: lysylphosphatidylglycerol synthase transmembrane domain-containing protein [Candidatus Kapabacteria bacterium]|nr:lysylphosphatidylglycerol synthase transmembrane domain-containing protein [Candidatus Kapabacteria bacterium]